NAMETLKKPLVLVLGGAKPDDSLKIMKHWLEKKIVDKVLTSGVVGELVLLASGCKLGRPTMDFLEKKKYTSLVPAIKELAKFYSAAIEMPSDVAVDKNGRKEFDVGALPIDAQIKDIGTKTAERYAAIIKSAGTVVLNGPAGVYEEEAFSKGTRTILSAITECKCFSLIGGGNTISAIDEAHISKKKFSYISLAGKALISYLSGEPMPGVDALKKSKQTFKSFNGMKKK
ncbi:MAG: phosphoglycerate kinase, partial [Candidatus Micrarchaeota archaeon]